MEFCLYSLLLRISGAFQAILEGIVSGSLNCGLSKCALDFIPLSDNIKKFNYLVKEWIELCICENLWRLRAGRGQCIGVMVGSYSALYGVEYKCSGSSGRVHDCISLSDKLKIYNYLVKISVLLRACEDCRTNKNLPPLFAPVP